MYTASPADRVRVSKQWSLFVSRIQKPSIRFGWKRLSTTHAYHAVLGVARSVGAQLSDDGNPVNVRKPLQGLFCSCVVPERRRRIRASTAHSETRFIEQGRRQR